MGETKHLGGSMRVRHQREIVQIHRIPSESDVVHESSPASLRHSDHAQQFSIPSIHFNSKYSHTEEEVEERSVKELLIR